MTFVDDYNIQSGFYMDTIQVRATEKIEQSGVLNSKVTKGEKYVIVAEVSSADGSIARCVEWYTV